MRLLSLLIILAITKCGSDTAANAPTTSERQPKVEVLTPVTEVKEDPPVEKKVEEEEPLSLWDRAWPAQVDRETRMVPASTAGGLSLQRTFVTDTINLNLEWDEESEVYAIFTALVDLAVSDNARVNDNINQYLLRQISPAVRQKGTAAEQLRAIGKKAIKDYQRERSKAMEEEEADVLSSFRQTAETTVLRNDSSFLVITLKEYAYGGGANGGFYRDDLSFSTKTGKLIKLTDVIARNKQMEFKKIVHAAALAEGHDHIAKAADFPLPENFLFTPEGMLFYYPEYSAALSNRWMVDLVVPYGNLEGTFTEIGKEMLKGQI